MVLTQSWKLDNLEEDVLKKNRRIKSNLECQTALNISFFTWKQKLKIIRLTPSVVGSNSTEQGTREVVSWTLSKKKWSANFCVCMQLIDSVYKILILKVQMFQTSYFLDCADVLYAYSRLKWMKLFYNISNLSEHAGISRILVMTLCIFR